MHFTVNLLPSAIFEKKNTCPFRKTPMFYLIKPNFERFENSYFLSRTLRQICYLMRIFVKITVFFRITHFIFSTEAIFYFLNVLRSPTFSVAFYDKYATFSILKKIKLFSENPFIVFQKKTQFFNVLRTLTDSVAFYSKTCNLWQFFFEKSHLIFFKFHFFERFVDSYYFSRMVVQTKNGTISNF